MTPFLKYAFRASLPSIGSSGSILLYQPDPREREYVLSCSASGREIIGKVLSTAESGQYSQKWEVEITRSKAETILKLCDNIPISVGAARPEIFGLDGYDLTLELYSGMNTVSFT